jgi:hypothetical protein
MKRLISKVFILGVCSVWFLAMPVSEIAAQTSPTENPGISAEVQGENTRQVSAPSAIGAPTPSSPISFIDSPDAYCYQPNPDQNICYINWGYIQVSAGANQYMIYLTILLNGRLVARNHGFFQTYMYIPSSMNGQGFKVECGKLGSGGDPDLGRAYSWEMHAQETGGLKAANYGTVYCPAHQGAFK